MLEFIEKEIQNLQLDVYGIEIHKNNELIYKKFFAEDIRYPIYSATKTITSAAFGIAKSERKISEDDFLCDYLEKKYLELLSEKQLENFRKLTIKRFLTMSVEGFPFRPSGEDWIEFSLLSNNDFGRSPKFSYSNISAYLVGVACENAVRKPLYDYINEKIFQPLNIPNPPYKTCPKGHFYGATGMELTVDELSRTGRIYLDGGVYNGERILPESWVKHSTEKQIDNNEGGYGYFIWINNDSFRISGKWGQKSLVYPNKNLVITYMSNLTERGEKMLEIAEKAAALL